MMNEATVFRIKPSLSSDRHPPFVRQAGRGIIELAEKVLEIDKFNSTYREISKSDDLQEFVGSAIHKLSLDFDILPGDRERIPQVGPLIVTANHPFGLVDPLCMIQLILQRRSDLKIITNHLLATIPEIAPICIFVEPQRDGSAAKQNVHAMREAVQWLKQGGIIGVFPAGEVASLDLRYARVVEAEWSVHIARLIRLGQAAALPIYFHGTNSLLFHLSGLVHPMLRTALLPRESLKRRRTPIRVVVGNSIPFKRLTSFQKDTDMVDYLKKRTFLLKHRPSDKKVVPARVLGKIDSTVQAATAILHKFEIESLPSNQRLLQVGELEVYFANADQIPMGLLEIGRLREITFREVGEGSGLPVDIDRFDNHYIHLFIWNRARTEFVGAYRMGKTDEIFRRFGKNGLYTSTLFDYREELMERLNPALELGRSWVRKEYQKSSIALALLWRGICTYVVANPRYHRLFGPVSLSNDYHNISHQLIVHFVRKHCFHDDFARHLKSFQPFKPRLPWNMRRNIQLETMEDLSALVSDLETDGKGVPVLLKEYVKFGGKILGFNIDHEFGSVVDGLVMVDLLETNPRLLERYMGKTGKAAFLAHYGIEETVSFPVPEISAEAS